MELNNIGTVREFINTQLESPSIHSRKLINLQLWSSVYTVRELNNIQLEIKNIKNRRS